MPLSVVVLTLQIRVYSVETGSCVHTVHTILRLVLSFFASQAPGHPTPSPHCWRSFPHPIPIPLPSLDAPLVLYCPWLLHCPWLWYLLGLVFQQHRAWSCLSHTEWQCFSVSSSGEVQPHRPSLVQVYSLAACRSRGHWPTYVG